jgi:cobalt-zinc-cadmium resistance protein CzcA
MQARVSELRSEIQKYVESITYYLTIGKALSDEIFKTASKSYENGEIDFFNYILSLENAKQIEMDYLINLDRFNQVVLEINYITL